MGALLVVGHGTTSPAGVNQFEELVHLVRATHPGDQVEGGFLELSSPPLRDAAARLASGHPVVDVVPLVLVAAGHSKGDIPAALARETARHPGLSFRYARPLGPHPDLLADLADRLAAVVDRSRWESTAVLLVGRGATDPDANAEVAKTSRLLYEGRGIGTVETCFVSLARPDVPSALDRTARLGFERIVVLPYFLFAGVLPDRIAEQARVWGAEHPDVDLRLAGVIGPSARLAGLVAQRRAELSSGDIRMNCDTCAYRVPLPGFADKLGAPQHPHHHPEDPAHHHEDPAHHHPHP